MTERNELQDRIERMVGKAQDEILRASHQLSREVTHEAERLVPPMGQDLTRLIDGIFDFAQHVVEYQRKMVADVLKAIEEAVPDGRVAKGRARKTTGRHRVATTTKASTPARKHAATTTRRATAARRKTTV